ncbi:DUF4279 domain-containing protein [Rosenbergiella collisarenosi]|uniref:DUF4279 domain-containing protein n=1 Tax=Rosenbergiella collisarenosi TaxID=1544695 RepID=UPI001BD9453B|nr:DUF4279 domain-containing protein [Rosenbergiella collisarenosi]MBT0721500.1 DUF4279 domain-containing protein [Rosenbergiella collisarenosi]
MKEIAHHRTPVNKIYRSCYECYASIRIYPAATHPDEITTLLEQESTLLEVVGQEITNSRGRTRKVKYSIWELCTEGFLKSQDLREHIDWLLDKMEPKSTELQSLQEVPDLIMCIYCIWKGKRGHGGPVLWPEQMRRMGELNIECSFDVYFFSED